MLDEPVQPLECCGGWLPGARTASSCLRLDAAEAKMETLYLSGSDFLLGWSWLKAVMQHILRR